MQNLTVQTVNKRSIFYWQLLLTSFLILAEISFFIQCNQAYLSGFAEVSQQLKIPYEIVPGISFFLLIQLGIHFVFTLCAWALTLGLYNLKRFRTNQLSVAISVWLLLLATVLLANQVYVPNSKFAELTQLFFPDKLAIYALVSLLIINFLLLVLFLFYARKWLFKINSLLLIASVVLVGLGIYTLTGNKLIHHTVLIKPNVIIVGIDSLRPDFLNFFGAETKTPTIDHFLQGSVVFTDAVTPLARTFPSWVTILTGKHPREIGVRSNLVIQDGLDLKNSLPAILKRQGYQTIFATDESRFSNIDINFGFDEIIAPPMGLNDFLIGSLNDFPISNLLVNTTIGKWLFPYSYANRGVFFTYNPDSFLQRVRTNLQQRPNKPLFLAVHFCLPHFPYLWVQRTPKKQTAQQRYQTSISGVDQQLNHFFAMLAKMHLLDNAIVVILSDHGEALELQGDRLTEISLYQGADKPSKFYPPSLDTEGFNQSAGHGTDVLGLTQYHTLLAFKILGNLKYNAGMVAGPVSLAQIKDTILEFLSKKTNKASLLTYIKKADGTVPFQHLFLESDFSPESIRTIYPKLDKVMLDGIQLFAIKPHTTRLVLKPDMEKKVIVSKQYADIFGDWMLALYPIDENMNTSILINLRTGAWTDDLKSSFAFASPAREMLVALKDFYGDEIKAVAKEYSHN